MCDECKCVCMENISIHKSKWWWNGIFPLFFQVPKKKRHQKHRPYGSFILCSTCNFRCIVYLLLFIFYTYSLLLTGPCGGKTTGQSRMCTFFENLGWKVSINKCSIRLFTFILYLLHQFCFSQFIHSIDCCHIY